MEKTETKAEVKKTAVQIATEKYQTYAAEDWKGKIGYVKGLDSKVLQALGEVPTVMKDVSAIVEKYGNTPEFREIKPLKLTP